MDIDEALDRVAALLKAHPDKKVLFCARREPLAYKAFVGLCDRLIADGVEQTNRKGPWPVIRLASGGRVFFRHSYNGGVLMRGCSADLAGVVDKDCYHEQVANEFDRSTVQCDRDNIFVVERGE